MTVITIPLNTGMHEESDQRLMTDGRLRTVRNGRLDREGRIRVRAGYTALSMTVNATPDTTALVPYDLASFNGRLVALGEDNGTYWNDGYAADVYEYTGISPFRWKATFHSSASPAGKRLPYATNLRDLPIVGDVPGGCTNAGAAALNGHVVLAYDAFGSDASESRSYARIILAATGQLLSSDDLDIGAGSTHFPINVQACATPTKLVVTAIDSNTTGPTYRKLFAYTNIPGTGNGLTLVSTPLLSHATDDLGPYNVAAITGGTGIVLAAVQGIGTGTVKVRQYDSAMAVVVPSGGQYADIVLASDPTSLAVEADVTQNTLTVAAIRNFDLHLYTYNLTTGAAIGTPPDGATIQSTHDVSDDVDAVSLVRYDSTNVLVSLTVIPTGAPLTDFAVTFGLFNPTTTAESAFSSGEMLRDAACASQALMQDGEIVMAVVRAAAGQNDVLLMANTRVNTTLQGWHVPLAAPDLGVSSSITPGFRSTLCRDAGTGKTYWLRGVLNEQALVIPTVTELDLGSTDRRQMVEMAGALHIAGGVVLRYDGNRVCEQGWLERPRIISATPSNSTGTLDNSATYTYVMTWEATDATMNVERSPVSAPTTVTMGAAEDTVTLVGSVPLSMRLNTNASDALGGMAVRCMFWRNTSDVVSGTPTPSATLQLVGYVDIDQTQIPGAPVTFVDTMGDSTLVTKEVLYTQIESPLDNHASQPAKYLSAASDALMASGLPNRNRWNISKPLQPFEGVAFAQNGILAFEGRVARGEIEQALGFQQSWLLATQKELWLLNGQGPDIRGIGEFQRTYRVPSDGGMRADGWRSVVEFGKGVMYQLQDDQLYLWAGGQPSPVGLEIQDTLLEFPNVVAACHVTGQQCVALALQNDAGDDGCIVLWDQQSNQWFRDDVGAVDALAEHDGRLAYLQGGVVYLEDEDYGTGTAPTLRIDTGNVAKTGVAGASGVQQIILTGVYQGDFMAELLIKYTDDQTFSSLGAIEFLASDGYAAGDPLDQEWRPTRDDTSRFELQLLVSGVGTGTKQGWLNALEVHYDVDEGPKRVPDARRR